MFDAILNFVFVSAILLVVLCVLSTFGWFPSLVCKLIGHKSMEKDYTGGDYMKVSPGAIDGIGREHATLYGTCPRCGKEHRVGRIHRPVEWFDGKIGYNDSRGYYHTYQFNQQDRMHVMQNFSGEYMNKGNAK